MRQTYARVKSETRDGSLNEIHDVVRSVAWRGRMGVGGLRFTHPPSLTPWDDPHHPHRSPTHTKQVRSIPALQQKYRGLNLHINIAEFLKASKPFG